MKVPGKKFIAKYLEYKKNNDYMSLLQCYYYDLNLGDITNAFEIEELKNKIHDILLISNFLDQINTARTSILSINNEMLYKMEEEEKYELCAILQQLNEYCLNWKLIEFA